ncbi:MAG: response regulator transcription factor [Pseudomonadota bacterium]
MIVEDEVDIAESMQLFLHNAGYQSVHVDDGREVIAGVKQEKPDLVVMDIMLPGVDGIACTKEIRSFSNVPIIMVTARGEQSDKIKGLALGVDDYVSKPFDIEELMLRIKAVLRRVSGSPSFTQWRIQDDTMQIFFLDKKVKLSTLEFALFNLLFKAPERVYSREQIIELAYSDDRDITDRAIDSHVKNIRRKLRDQGIEYSPIQSVYGAGYAFKADEP